MLARPDQAPQEQAESGIIVAVGRHIESHPELGPLLTPGTRVGFHPKQVHSHRSNSGKDLITLVPASIDCIIEDDPDDLPYGVSG